MKKRIEKIRVTLQKLSADQLLDQQAIRAIKGGDKGKDTDHRNGISTFDLV